MNGTTLYVGGTLADVNNNGTPLPTADYVAKWIGQASVAPCASISSASGNWGAPATWSCGRVPGPGEAVTIAAGHTVTLDQDVQTSGNLDVQGTLDTDSKTVTMTGCSAQTLKGNPLTFYNLVVNKTNATDVVTVDGKLKATKKLTVTKGKLKSASDYGDVEIGPAGTLELTSDITVGGNWTNNGTFTHDNHAVTFDGTTLQTLAGSVATPFYRWVINATAQVFVTALPTAADSVENNGVLQQTQTVNSATVNFLQISTDKYRGLDITTTDNLGSVTVTISGNHATCTGDAGQPTVSQPLFPHQRRQNGNTTPAMATSSARTASAPSGVSTITAYTTATEDDVSGAEDLYQYNASFSLWQGFTATCGSNPGDSCTATSVTLETGNNYFLIGGETGPPTAVTLSAFRAAPLFDPGRVAGGSAASTGE